jgi:uncharacterized protein (DUF924 family)
MNHPVVPSEAQGVLDFWFAKPGEPGYGEFRSLWFVKSDETDRLIAERFATLIDAGLNGKLGAWAQTPAGTLAAIVLLDQFTRNAFRDTPRAFAGDDQALRWARELVAQGGDAALPPVQRAFVYLPFEHSESLALQDECVRLFTALAAEAPALATMLDYAHRHREVIRRFGRFPHRNEVLGRPSTAEEAAFLQEPGSRF